MNNPELIFLHVETYAKGCLLQCFLRFVIVFIIFFSHCPVGRVFANGPGDLGSIPGHIIPKILKMVLDASLLNTQQYKVRIKIKVEQYRERGSALPYSSV